MNCTVSCTGENTFITNSATNHGGGFAVIHSKLHLNGSAIFKNNSAAIGGGVYINDSTVHIDGNHCFRNNTAGSEGGGIYARGKVMKFNGKHMFVANLAEKKGAAIHMSFTTSIFQGTSTFMNNSAEYGGGIYCESSNLTVVHYESTRAPLLCTNCESVCNDPRSVHKTSFFSNSALQGGAQYFDLYSNFSLYQTAYVHFQDNHASEFGGAIYAVDVPGSGHYLSQQHLPFRSKCFFPHSWEQTISWSQHNPTSLSEQHSWSERKCSLWWLVAKMWFHIRQTSKCIGALQHVHSTNTQR